MIRKGLGKGMGSGYRNILMAHDKRVHRDAGLGRKQPQRAGLLRGGYAMNPSYDSRKSFYGKADIRVEGNKKILKSYSTDVAYIDLDTGKAVVNGMYSNTTLRHIKEFLKQNGFKADSWKQIEKDYSPKKEEYAQYEGTSLRNDGGQTFEPTEDPSAKGGKGGKNYLNKNIKGKTIRLLEEYTPKGLNNKDIYLVEGGFGADKDTIGSALFIKNLRTGESFRIDASDKIKLVNNRGGKNGNYAWSKDLGGKIKDYGYIYILKNKTTGNKYSIVRPSFRNAKTDVEYQNKIQDWKKGVLKEYGKYFKFDEKNPQHGKKIDLTTNGGKKPLSTRTAKYLKHGVKDVGHDIGKGLKWTGRKIRGGKERIRHGKYKGENLFHQGDRILQGTWSDKRWKTATRKDNKQSGKKYEDWERPHISKKTKKMVKGISWK
jgi:hypothetical protein